MSFSERSSSRSGRSRGDHPAVAHLGARFGGDGTHQQGKGGFRCLQFGKSWAISGADCSINGARNSGRRASDSRRLARSRGRALRRRYARQCVRCRRCRAGPCVPRRPGGRSLQAALRRRRGAGRNFPFAQRVVQGVAQQPGTHAGHAVVEQRKQGRRGLATQGFGQFQVAPGGQIKAEIRRLPFPRSGRADAAVICPIASPGHIAAAPRPQRWLVSGLGPKAGQRGHFELVAEQAASRVVVEIPVRLAGAGDIDVEIGRPAFRIENFGRADAFQRRGT